MGRNDIEIRLARLDEATAIAAVLWASFAEYEMLYTAEGFRATALEPDIVRQRMQEGPLWAAALSETIVGTAAAIASSDGLYVRGMAVVPLARGKGIAKRLLQHAEHYALSLGCSRMFLSTTPFLIGAISLYERAGFRRTGEGPHDLFGTPLFTMEKWLHPVSNLSE